MINEQSLRFVETELKKIVAGDVIKLQKEDGSFGPAVIVVKTQRGLARRILMFAEWNHKQYMYDFATENRPFEQSCMRATKES